MLKTTEMWIMLLYDGTGTHVLLEKRKRKRKNIGLDFSIIFENWLNLWKYKHWKLVEAQLHTWYAYIDTNQPSIHTKRYVRHVWDILNQLYFISAWFLLLCYFVGNSESAGRKTALKCGLIWAPSTRIRRKKLRFQKCQDSCGQGRRRIHSA